MTLSDETEVEVPSPPEPHVWHPAWMAYFDRVLKLSGQRKEKVVAALGPPDQAFQNAGGWPVYEYRQGTPAAQPGGTLPAQQSYTLVFGSGKLTAIYFKNLSGLPTDQTSPERPPTAEEVWYSLQAPAAGPTSVMVRKDSLENYVRAPDAYPIGPDGQRVIGMYLRTTLPDGRSAFVYGVAPPHLLGRRQFNIKTDRYDLVFERNPAFNWKTMPVLEVDIGNSRNTVEYTTFIDYPLP